MNNKKNEKIIKISITIAVIILVIWFFIFNPLFKFKKMENTLRNASKRYFEINEAQLPTGNKIRKISLQTLYDKDFIKDDMRAPYTNKYCDSQNSFVKVNKNNNQYNYSVYLECGVFKSRVDHKGPIINLNGEDEITVYQGDKYTDLGVKDVYDNTDGKIDSNKVEIDTSNVNTSKVGTYKVTYTINDSLDNETVKIRKVKVIQTLNNVLKKKKNTELYLKLDGIVFQVVGVNKDKSVKVVSSETLGSIDYSGIDTWLNDYFYNKLSDGAKEHIKTDSIWCNEQVSNTNEYKKCNSYTKKQAVGLISIDEYNKSNINVDSIVWTYNKENGNRYWANTSYNPNYDSKYTSTDKTTILGVKPALNIKKDEIIVSGIGTYNNPYILKNNNVVLKKGTKINEAPTGSYINYSGYNFRVISKDDDDTTKVVMLDNLKTADNDFYTNYDNQINKYDPTRKSNLGYKIVNQASNYINTSFFDKKNIKINSYKNKVLYNKQTSFKNYSIKLNSVSIFDLYGSTKIDGVSTWYQESSDKDNYLNSATYGITTEKFDSNIELGIKVSGYLNKNVVVRSGSGTKYDPYTLTK